jgi:hypothetical protein
MKKIQAEDVAQVNDWMMRFGIPDSILSDRSILLEAVYE